MEASSHNKFTTKKKIFVIVGAVAALIVIVAVTVLCVLFVDPRYDVDLALLKENTPYFIDEFDADHVDTDVWNVYDADPTNPDHPDGMRRGGYWIADQVFTQNGTLVIRTEERDGKFYTGAIDSSGKLEKKYGYFETRCKLPKGLGIWSAFWLLCKEFDQVPLDDPKDAQNCAKYGAEIDIFEAPCWPKNKVQQAIHKGGYQEAHKSTFPVKWVMNELSDLYDTYNTFGLYWDENIYKFYFNDQCLWTTHYQKNVSKVDQYLFLSVEIGGANGKPTHNDWEFVGGKVITENAAEVFPMDFVVDYVKIWDLDKRAL